MCFRTIWRCVHSPLTALKYISSNTSSSHKGKIPLSSAANMTACSVTMFVVSDDKIYRIIKEVYWHLLKKEQIPKQMSV